MRFGKSVNYAILAVGYIARQDKSVRSYEIGKEYSIPLEYLLKILQQLVRANILSSKRGPAGGFTLAKTRKQINLLQIVEAAEGPVEEQLGLTEQASGDKFARKTETQYKKVAKQTKASLKKIRLDDLI